MYLYKAYNLRIHSDLALPGLPELSEAGVPDVTIRRGREIAPESGDGGRRISGQVFDLLRFFVEEGRSITVGPHPDLQESGVRSLVLGVLMATLLRQRGLFVLHACSVARDGRAICFVGDSGWGKSTLAEFFYQNGYSLLSDDVTAIDVEGAHPVVIPGYPQIKLRPDAGERLRHDFDTLPAVHFDSNKRLHTAEGSFEEAPVPLAKLYILEGAYGPRNAVVPLGPQASLVELIRHTRVTNLITDTAFIRRHLRQCAQMINRVPISRLGRVRSLEALPEILSVVAQDLVASCEREGVAL